MTNGLGLAEAVASRIAHDISGPLQAISAAIDLFAAEDEAIRAEAGELAAQAVRQLMARVALIRAAWGREGAPLSVDAVAKLAADALASSGVSVDIGRVGGADRPVQGLDRVLLGALLVGAQGLPRGGAIVCAGSAGDMIALSLSGEQAAWPAGLAALLAGEDPGAPLLEPRNIALPMLVLMARRHGVDLALLLGAGQPLLTLTPRPGAGS